MIISLILNEGPYGSEKTYNALRLAMALQKKQPQNHDNQDPPVEVRGIAHLTLVEGADISSMEELSRWVIESDKILVF